MVFAHDTTAALLLAADLVNSAAPAPLSPQPLSPQPSSPQPLSSDPLGNVAGLEAFLDQHLVAPRSRATPADLDALRELRPRLRAVWEATGSATRAGLINDLLAGSGARPRLVDHGGGWGWHLHVTGHDAALQHRIAAQAGFALADLVRAGEEARLRGCEAPGCDAVFVDLSRNRSRRYCDTGNCGNRQHVAAYRERLAARDADLRTRGG